jgi:hypothetical protein
MRVQTTLAFVPVRRASEGDGALHSRRAASIDLTPALSRKRDSDSLLAAPSSKRFAVPRRTTGTDTAAPDAEEERTERVTKTDNCPVKTSTNLSSFLQWYGQLEPWRLN